MPILRMLSVALAAVPAMAASSTAQEAGKIARIEIVDRSGRPASEAVAKLVRARIRSRVGAPFDRRTATEDLDRLRDLTAAGSGFRFDERTGTLTFQIEALLVLSEIRIIGNRHFSESEILSQLTGVTPGVRVEEGVIVERLRALEGAYRQSNFYFARVRYDAEELRRRQRLVIRVSEGPRVRVRKVTFEGLSENRESDVRPLVDTRPHFWPFLEGRLDEETLESDERRLTEYLRGRGYLNARVGRRLNWLNAGKTEVEVVFTVHEGVRFRIHNVEIIIEKVPSEPKAVFTPEELRGRLRTPKLTYFNKQALEEDVRALQDAYGEVGRFGIVPRTDGVRDTFGSEIRGERVFPRGPGADDRREVDVRFTIKEAPRTEIGRIEVVNNRNVKSRVILRVLRYYGLMPGEVLNSVSLRNALRELEGTRLFAPVPERPFALRIEPAPARDGAPDVRDLIVDVNEQPQTGSIRFGAGFNTNFGLTANITYSDRNYDITDWPDHWREILSNLLPGRGEASGRPFTGAGEDFLIELQPGLERSSGRMAWRTPYFLDRGFSLGVDLYGLERSFDEYTEFRAGVSLSVGRRLSENWRVEATLRPEMIDVTARDDDPFTQPNPPPAPPPNGDDRAGALLKAQGTFFQTRLIFQAVMDNRRREGTDRIAAYSDGDILSLLAAPSFGSFQYVETGITYQRLWTVRTDVDNGKDVLSVTAKLGYIFGNVPVFDRFYAGGTGSIRGFAYRGVGPREGPRFDRVGGKFLLAASAEYSVPIVSTDLVVLRGFAFVDFATVERTFKITQVRLSVGPGVRMTVPAVTGPIPLEIGVGIPIIKSAVDDKQLFFLTAGFQF